VRAVSLAEAADELYGLPPAEFIAARDERARAARSAGLPEDAAAIRKLARPTTSAWLVNQLSREAPERLGRLFDVAAELQEAQRTLAGDRLRELSAHRRQVVTELLPVAAAVARRRGQTASGAVLEEVRATLEAALADAAAREAVRAGRLTRALAYAGLGEVDLTTAVLPAPAAAAGRRGVRPARSDGPAGGPQADHAELDPGAGAAAAVAAAESAAASAVSAIDSADRELSGIAEQRQFLARRISHLEGELAQARDEDGRLAAAAQRSEQTHDRAARELRAAERRLERARRELAALAGPGES